MHKDCLGNTYARLPGKPPNHTAKSTKSAFVGRRGRSKRDGDWRKKVKEREARHRAWGHRFTPYPC